jgi:8-amino-7-oxononanoate synthase
MTGLEAFAIEKLEALEAAGVKRALPSSAARNGAIDFCSNDYLGLSQDARTIAAAAAALREYGAGAGASRLVTGNYSLLESLERRIAGFKGCEAALVFGSGYLANLGTIPAIMGEGDLILADALSHSCLMSGARLSRATMMTFAHNDCADLQRLLHLERARHRHCLIVSEGVFSMDGDLAPLPDLIRIARAFDAWTLIDDAHALGVIGAGRGSSAHWGVAPDIEMGTLSKAAGSYGGYVAGSGKLIELMISRARSFVFSTGLPPASAGASLAAIDIIERDSELCAQPVRKAQIFCRELNLSEPQSSIVPLILGAPQAALAASAMLAERGFIVTAIRPPTVPEGTSRLRFTFSAKHQDEDVVRLAGLVRKLIVRE